MREITMTPWAALADFLDTPRTATVAALIGIIGAAVSLQGLPLFFLAASLPMSGLGVLLGLRQHNEAALLIGLTGTGLAVLGLA